jgi:energy-coupling factor transporter ATP-binding protein EcfA2
LAVLFAWRTVAKMRNSAATNLLIFDEVLDSSLDQYGIDEFLRIIQSLTEHENIFIISHRGDAIGDKFDNVLKFAKVKGFSQLTEAA